MPNNDQSVEGLLAWRERLGRQVRVDGDYLIVDIGYSYEIALSRLDSAEKILAWVHHLSQKANVSAEILGEVIVVAGRQIGWVPEVSA